MFKKLNQLFCAHIYDLYIDDHDNPAKEPDYGFALAQIKTEGSTYILGTHAKCCVCGKVIFFISANFNP